MWSPAGPVLGVSVGPDLLSQSNLSSAPCTQTHRPSSKEQPQADRAADRKRTSESTFCQMLSCRFLQSRYTYFLKHATSIPHEQYIHVYENCNENTWWLVGFFAVQKRDIIHSNNLTSGSSVRQSPFIHATEPNLRIEIILFMLLKN